MKEEREGNSEENREGEGEATAVRGWDWWDREVIIE